MKVLISDILNLQSLLDSKVDDAQAGAFGLTLLGTATAAEATSALNTFTTSLKGLVPAPTTSTGKFLKDDGTWAQAGGGGSWGDITGTLADQTDLSNALATKAPLASPVFTGEVQAEQYNFTNSVSYIRPSNEVRCWNLTGKTFAVSSQENSPTGIYFKPDGTRMYIVGTITDRAYAYDLSTAWDVTTAVVAEQFSVSSWETAPSDIHFSADGTKLYIAGYSGDDVNEFSLPTPWVLTGATFVQSYVLGQGQGNPYGIHFSPDGLRLYSVDSITRLVYQYSLSVAWDISTTSYVQSISVGSEELTPQALSFNSDGSRMFVVGSSGDDITEYRLSTPWDISTASHFSESSTISDLEDTSTGLFYDDSNGRAFTVGSSSRFVREWDAKPQTKYFGGSFTTDGQLYVGGRVEFRDYAYFNSTIRTNAGLVLNGGISGAYFLSLSNGSISGATSISNSSTHTLTRSIQDNATDGFISQNTTNASAGIPIQRSPRIRLRGNAWDTTATTSRATDFAIENIPSSGASVTARLAFTYSPNSGAYSEILSLGSDGSVTATGDVNITGALNATTKSFVIDHPTKPNKILRHGSLEGPEFGVYVRGRSTSTTIALPEYWLGLVDPDSITVTLTSIGRQQNLFVESVENNIISVGGADSEVDFFYTVFGERKDIDRLELED